MTKTLRIAAALATALVATPVLAADPAAAPAAPASAPAPNPAILLLPLQPVVPADHRTCAAKTASGLGYSELNPGNGAKPGAKDFVLVNYIGYLASNGQTFDQNVRAPLELGGVIAGFAEGVQMMPRGSVYRFCIPAAQGYGAKEMGAIPANSDLVFQIELMDFKSPAEVEAIRTRQMDEAAKAAKKN